MGRTIVVSLAMVLTSCSNTSRLMYWNAQMSSTGNYPPRVVQGDKCVLELAQFRDGDTRRVGFCLWLEVPPELLVRGATYHLPHPEIQAVLHRMNDGVATATRNCEGQIKFTSVGKTSVGLKVNVEALVAKNPSTKEPWRYAGDARYVVTQSALPAEQVRPCP